MHPLPANATRIRYLESTGTQYINTGITIKSGLGFRAAFEMPAANKGTLFGARNSDKSVRNFVWLGGNSTGANNYRHDYGNQSVQSLKNAFAGTKAVISVDDNVVRFTDTSNNTTWTKSSTAQTFSANLNIFVFGLNNAGSIADRPGGCKCYYLKILDNGVLVRDYVPVRVGNTGELFDRVTGTYATRSGTFTCGPDSTIQQGVVPTRMMAMGVRTTEKPPTEFNYLGIKIVASRWMRNCASLAAYRNVATNMMQMSEFQILDANDSRYILPSDATFFDCTAYNGERHYSDTKLVSSYNSGESIGRIFDGNTSTKWGAYRFVGYAPIFDFDTGETLMVQGDSYDATFMQTHFGVGNNVPVPISIVVDVSSKPLDLSTFTKWRLLNANDNASQTNRTVVEMEVLGSIDGTTWWRLGISNNPNAINTNYAVSHYGNFAPRKGDIWSDLDLATRDWSTGIAVDNY